MNPPLKDTIALFWTSHHLQAFQQAWDGGEYDTNWTTRIYQQGIEFKHWKTEAAVDSDVQKLFNVARSGCNMTLNREYQKLHDKWSDRRNDEACDYLANAWDIISTVQIKLARRWGVYIEWQVD